MDTSLLERSQDNYPDTNDEIAKYIFTSKYARFLEGEGRRETWDEAVDRVRAMHVKRFGRESPDIAETIRVAFDAVREKRVLPSMRAMQFGGVAVEANHLRQYNCLAEETEFITTHGVKSFKDFNDGDVVTILGHSGEWRLATVRNFGMAELHPVQIDKGKNRSTVWATDNHRWMNRQGEISEGVSEGAQLRGAADILSEFDWDSAEWDEKLYWAYGLIFGDGTRLKDNEGTYKRSMIRLCGADKKYAPRFEELGFATSTNQSLNGDFMAYGGTYLKTAPDPTVDDPRLIRAFVRGYLDADGEKDKGTTGNQFLTITSAEEDHIEFIRNCFPIAGAYIVSETDLTGEITNFGVRGHTVRFRIFNKYNNDIERFVPGSHFRVSGVGEEARYEEVWCLQVEEDSTFTLKNGLVTGNCAVRQIDSVRAFAEAFYLLLCGCGVGLGLTNRYLHRLPNLVGPDDRTGTVMTYVIEDTIEGWADSIEALLNCYVQATAYSGRKIVFDYSRIRPKGSPLKTSGGKAPGYEGLKAAHIKIKQLLDRIIEDNGQERMRSVDVYDVLMHCSDAVLSGGVRRCLPGETLVKTVDGPVRICDVLPGAKVDTPKGVKEVKNVFYQGEQELVKIIHPFGEFECTPNHKMAVFTSVDSWEFKRADELTTEDRLVWDSTAWAGSLQRLPSLDLHRELDSSYARSNGAKEVNLPEYVTEDFAWLVGIIQGDGYNYKGDAWASSLEDVKGKVEVSFHSDQTQAIERTRRILQDLSPETEVRVKSIKGENCGKVSLHNARLVRWLRRHVKVPNVSMHVPEWIVRSEPAVRGAYLMGLFDSDGSVSSRRSMDLVESVYPEFLQEVNDICKTLGWMATLRLARPAVGNWQALYKLSVTGFEFKDKFLELMGLQSRTVDPSSYYGSLRSGGREGLNFLIEDNKVPVRLLERESQDILPVPVLAVEASRTAETYDIEVEGIHQFTAEGFVTHNSATLVLFDKDDEDMLNAKTGDWFKTEPQRARSNNSVLLVRGEVSEDEFNAIYERTKEWGEPGFVFTDSDRTMVNPSLRGDTRVLTDRGVLPISKLEGESFKVKNLFGDWADASCRLSGADKQLFKVNLVGGHSYYATKEHKWPVKTARGFQKRATVDLQAGDQLPSYFMDSIHEGQLGDYEDGFLVGWLYGDGWITDRSDNGVRQYGLIVSEDDKKAGVLDRLTNALSNKIVKGLGRPINWSERNGCYETNFQRSSANEYFRSFGVDKKENGLPGAAWTGSEEFRKGLVDGLFSSDGSVNVSSDSPRRTLAFSSSRKQLVADLAELLGFYGVQTTIHHQTIKRGRTFPNGKSYDREYEVWQMYISKGASVAHFVDVFYLTHEQKRQKYLDVVELGDGFVWGKDSSIKVASIEKIDSFEDVWDLSVDDRTHCFRLGQCVTGNCAEIVFIPELEDGTCGVQVCNLTSVNGANVTSEEDLYGAVRAATVIGTLQAGYTDFKYLSNAARELTEDESLLGVSITGMFENPDITFDPEVQRRAAAIAVETNRIIADAIGIRPAARVTCIKPEGSGSLALGTMASGIHAPHAPWMFRRVQANKEDNVYKWFKALNPDHVEPSAYSANGTDDVITFPIRVPDSAVFKGDLSAIEHLEMIKSTQKNWVIPGTTAANRKPIHHSVSCTVVVQPDEWGEVAKYLYENAEFFSAVSLLGASGDKDYVQAPNEAVSTEEDVERFHRLMNSFVPVDYSYMQETEDNTEHTQEISCAGGACLV